MPKLSLSFQRWSAADTIEGVVMTDDRAPGEFAFATANRGRFVKTDGIYVLVLENGSNFIHSASGDVRHVAFEQLSVPLKAAQARNHARGYYEESIEHLLNPPATVREDRHLWAAWVTEGHHRIINPLRCIGCVLLVLGILIPGRQGNTELIVRLIVALGVSFGEDAASTVAFAVAQETVEAVPLLYLVPLISAVLGSLLLWSGDRQLKHSLPWPKWRGFALRAREATPQGGAD
jgi:lipopolysaccharide export LptBFGC system permease protein LptF